MNFNVNYLFRAILFVISMMFFASNAMAGVSLGATRVVFYSNEDQENLYILGDKTNSYLIQSWIEDKNGNSTDDFAIVPPLFLLKDKKDSVLRIVKRKNNFPEDRESLFWITVKSIPSSKQDSSENTLQFAIANRIKMFYRPDNLRMKPDTAYGKLAFKKIGNKIFIINDSPYYITLVDFYAGNSKLKNMMAEPLAQTEVVGVKGGFNGQFSYKVINDYGAETEIYKALLSN